MSRLPQFRFRPPQLVRPKAKTTSCRQRRCFFLPTFLYGFSRFGRFSGVNSPKYRNIIDSGSLYNTHGNSHPRTSSEADFIENGKGEAPSNQSVHGNISSKYLQSPPFCCVSHFRWRNSARNFVAVGVLSLVLRGVRPPAAIKRGAAASRPLPPVAFRAACAGALLCLTLIPSIFT